MSTIRLLAFITDEKLHMFQLCVALKSTRSREYFIILDSHHPCALESMLQPVRSLSGSKLRIYHATKMLSTLAAAAYSRYGC